MESLTQNSLVVSALSRRPLPLPPLPYPTLRPALSLHLFSCHFCVCSFVAAAWSQFVEVTSFPASVHCVSLALSLSLKFFFFWKAPRCVFLLVSAHPSLENHLERRPTFTCGTYTRTHTHTLALTQTASECYHEKTLTRTNTLALNVLKIPSTYCMPNGIPYQFFVYLLPIPLSQLGIRSKRIAKVWINWKSSLSIHTYSHYSVVVHKQFTEILSQWTIS